MNTIKTSSLPLIDISGETGRHTIVAAGTKDVYQGHPTTVLTRTGKLLCVWTLGHGGHCGPAAESLDGGRTWARIDERFPAVYRERHANCPTLQKLALPGGRERLFVFSACGQRPEGNLYTHLGIVCSDDDGTTWRELPPADVASGMPPTGFMPLADGSCALFGQIFKDPANAKDRPTDDQQIWMSVSRDGGETWSPMRIIASAPEKNLCEPFAIRSPDGAEIALLLRENRHTAFSMMVFSADEGKTWTEPVDTCCELTGDRHEGVVLPDGRLFVAFRDRALDSPTYGHYVAWVGSWDDLRNGRSGRCRVKLLHSHAGETGLANASFVGDTGYSGVELLADGDLLCTTYVKYWPDARRHSVVCTRFRPSDADVPYLRGKWRGDATDPATGLGLDALKTEADRIVAAEKDAEPWCIVKARLFETICDRMAVGFSPHDFFPAFACWSRKDRILTKTINERVAEIDAKYCPDASERAKALRGSCIRHDYDHAVPDWDRALALGFPGLKAAADASTASGDFIRAMRIAAAAMVRCVRRLADCARGSPRSADPRVAAEAVALERLAEGPPRTAYEAMLFQLLFFVFGEHVDHLQVRSLGNWDRLLLPFYEADLAAKRLTRESFKTLLRHFWWQWGSIDNRWGQPLYLGGTKPDGSTGYNEVSRIVLEVADELALPTPKIQLKIADGTPEDVWAKALDMARRHRPVVFCGEEPMAKAMTAMGFSPEEARTCDIWGCYEFQPRAAANTTLPCIVNLPRIVADLLEEARAGRFAADTFDGFVSAFHDALRKRIAVALDVVRDYESHMDDWIPALVHSLSVADCVAKGKNAIGNGMKHNLSVVLQTGAGTAVDSLAAVKEIVFEHGETTLAGLGGIMAEDWHGHEKLRLRMSASRRKWGNNDPLANGLAHDLFRVFGEAVNGKPNSRNGKFFAAGHSIDYFASLGRMTGATPDGRHAGEEFSKNISPSPGADREGPTALIEGIAAIDPADIPGDVILDTTLHPSLVRGGKGLAAMKTLVREYFASGGCAIQFNVFGSDELRDAQAHPEKHENLQVRVCGWNARWNDIPREQQDAYIRRAETTARG